jgi:hypothetical protein
VSLLKGDSGAILVGLVLILVLIFMTTFCGCANRNIIDLDSCNYEELLDCVSSHRIETSREAVNLVVACQRDVCVRSSSRCQKIQNTSFVIIAEP